MNGDTDRIFRQVSDLVCRQVGPESILVPIRNNVGNLDSIYTLTPVAARIWALIDGTRTVAAIVDAICEEFDVDSDTARADALELIGELEEASLITMVEGR